MKIYNTLSRKKEEFITIEKNRAKIYVCGPTVYNYIHIGNARPIVVFDVLRRYLLYKGYKVDFVSNFTDIDDKIINKANEEGVDFKEITEKYIACYKEDCKDLNVMDSQTIHPKATEYVSQMIDFISGLIKKDAAYIVQGDVYFDISKAKNYGILSKKNIDDLIAGRRVEKNLNKRSPLDFVLWKAKKEGEPYWESPFGEGRPGWHIECSVMAKTILGDTIDIHAGGEDLQFPHHENEIAQSETLNEKRFANYWMHNGMINVDNKKMSKSEGNFFLVRDVKKVYDLEVLRLWILSSHYRNPINFTKEILDMNKNSLERLYNAKEKLEGYIKYSKSLKLEDEVVEKVDNFRKNFEQKMDDDLNTADGLSEIFELVSFINTDLSSENSKESLEYTLKTLKDLTEVLGLLYKEKEIIPENVKKLAEDRKIAKKNKDFALADKLREEIENLGFEIKDTREGYSLKEK
ncbi:cysteine--tRNA ligase [Citroniella saccharovorans]|uniref:Cysteine--tRNA ligase n=1 Tax=Citroniella saccharovorans TaxID=2053367 RepID=A0AAW9MU48_9FIRM|nr:cysteine--tRNA ligase [Citroniella saccharovorans]MEB3428458.1 cysteine--tRNA ligase [Citroniella saccharovorans]